MWKALNDFNVKRCDEIKALIILISIVYLIAHLLCLIARLGSSVSFQMITELFGKPSQLDYEEWADKVSLRSW